MARGLIHEPLPRPPVASNVATVRAGLAAFLRGDLVAMLAATSPDLVAVRQPPLPDARIYHGPQGLLQMWDDWTTEFGRFEMTVNEITDVGECVLVEVVQRGTGKASGVEVEAKFWLLCTLSGGKVVRFEAFVSASQALEAASAVNR